MNRIFHITSGDMAGGNLAKAGLPGEVFVWHDILYDGPRQPGWPDENTLRARARFLEEFTAGGLDRDGILKTLHHQYQRLAAAASVSTHSPELSPSTDWGNCNRNSSDLSIIAGVPSGTGNSGLQQLWIRPLQFKTRLCSPNCRK